MNVVSTLVTLIAQTPDCSVQEPVGLPILAAGHILPDDLRTFFELCGGVSLYGSSDYPVTIRTPSDVVPTNSILWRDLDKKLIDPLRDDRSWSWYAIADDQKGDYISIDLSPERLGRCYDSFWDRHAIPGESPIIAESFTELLERLFESHGQYWYWLREDFSPVGDAYD